MATNNAEIDDKKYIDQLLANGERVTLECKRARKDVPHSLWETYSAFANTDGGTILLGVDEDLKERTYPNDSISSALKMPPKYARIFGTHSTAEKR